DTGGINETPGERRQLHIGQPRTARAEEEEEGEQARAVETEAEALAGPQPGLRLQDLADAHARAIDDPFLVDAKAGRRAGVEDGARSEGAGAGALDERSALHSRQSTVEAHPGRRPRDREAHSRSQRLLHHRRAILAPHHSALFIGVAEPALHR